MPAILDLEAGPTLSDSSPAGQAVSNPDSHQTPASLEVVYKIIIFLYFLSLKLVEVVYYYGSRVFRQAFEDLALQALCYRDEFLLSLPFVLVTGRGLPTGRRLILGGVAFSLYLAKRKLLPSSQDHPRRRHGGRLLHKAFWQIAIITVWMQNSDIWVRVVLGTCTVCLASAALMTLGRLALNRPPAEARPEGEQRAVSPGDRYEFASNFMRCIMAAFMTVLSGKRDVAFSVIVLFFLYLYLAGAYWTWWKRSLPGYDRNTPRSPIFGPYIRCSLLLALLVALCANGAALLGAHSS